MHANIITMLFNNAFTLLLATVCVAAANGQDAIKVSSFRSKRERIDLFVCINSQSILVTSTSYQEQRLRGMRNAASTNTDGQVRKYIETNPEGILPNSDSSTLLKDDSQVRS